MRRALWLMLVISIGFLCLLSLKTPLNIYDEGLALVGGWRLTQGALPFRDYWTLYPPGQSLMLALLFKLFGVNILIERLYDVAIRALLAGVIFLVAQRLLSSRLLALFLTVSIGLLLAAATFFGYLMFPALLLAFWAIERFFADLDHPQPKRLIWIGLLCGGTALFRVDVAGYVLTALLIGLLLQQWRPAQTAITNTSQPWWRPLAWLIGGALLVAGPVYGYLVLVSNPWTLINNLLIFPATTFRAVRHLPYPSLLPAWRQWLDESSSVLQFDQSGGEWARFYIPLLVYMASAVLLFVQGMNNRGKPFAKRDLRALVVLSFGAALFLQATSRYDAIHALPTTLPTVLLIGWLWRRLTVADWWRPRYTPLPLLLTALPLLVYLYIPYAKLENYRTTFPPTECFSILPRAGCIPIQQDQAALVTALSRRDPSGQAAVFVAAQRHDKLFINDVSLYFLAGRPVPTRYHELHPGVATTTAVQQTIVTELSEQHVPWLFVVTYPESHEPNDSARSSGVTLLDEYIHAHYRAVEQYGIYELWQRH